MSVLGFRFLVGDEIFQSQTKIFLYEKKKSLTMKPKITVVLQGSEMPTVNAGNRTFSENDIH
jgi:hypothetical protein